MKIMKISKKAVSLLISVLMLLTAVPLETFAQNRSIELTQQELIEVLEGRHPVYKAEELFEPEKLFAPSTRVTAVEAQGGEVIEWVSKPWQRFRSEAKKGEIIVTYPNTGEYSRHGQQTFSKESFEKTFEKAGEETNLYRPKWEVRKYRKSKVDLTIRTSKKSTEGLFAGGYINVTKASDPHVSMEFIDYTYEPVSKLYEQSRKRLADFLESVGKKLPKDDAVLYKRFLRKGTTFTEKQIAKKIEQEAGGEVLDQTGKNVGEEVVQNLGKKTLKTIVGVIACVGLYWGFTVISAPTVQAENIVTKSRGEIIGDLMAEVGEVIEAEETGEKIEKIMIFTDPKFASIVAHDAATNGGELLKEMIDMDYSIEDMNMTEDKAAEIILELITPEYPMPFYNAFKKFSIEGIPGNINFDEDIPVQLKLKK